MQACKLNCNCSSPIGHHSRLTRKVEYVKTSRYFGELIQAAKIAHDEIMAFDSQIPSASGDAILRYFPDCHTTHNRIRRNYRVDERMIMKGLRNASVVDGLGVLS
jgi:hypothetical protein